MASSEGASPNKASPSVVSQWSSLISRSLEAWGALNRPRHNLAESTLKSYIDPDDFLTKFSTGLGGPIFWFFQRREAFLSQKMMTKWNRDRLDDYILLPGFPGFVTRDECFFVSHFWHSHDDPDPGGKYLKLMQNELETQPWSYIWVDWTCLPQQPRSENEEVYFLSALRTMPAIIRNCGFMWYYPGFEPRMWILYEVAEFVLTCENAEEHLATEDIKEFMDHVKEMREAGVGATLDKYGYKCTFDRDKEFITSWLELLILLDILRVHVNDIRRIQDGITWHRSCGTMLIGTLNGAVTIQRFEGTLTLGGEEYKFTPFPQWIHGQQQEEFGEVGFTLGRQRWRKWDKDACATAVLALVGTTQSGNARALVLHQFPGTESYQRIGILVSPEDQEFNETCKRLPVIFENA